MLALPATLTLLLVGCATLDDPAHPGAEGWRGGYVTQVGTATTLGARERDDCRDEVSATTSVTAASASASASEQRYAVVSYAHLRSWRYAVMPLTPDTDAAAGQAVWFRLGECRPPEPKSPAPRQP